ncbi:DUF2970 domain-containing protein [uncultured Nitrosomonas sp.]|uniref:DUF2970 domain-containing protein n=1 Tax=uncultured Nitrosomonas sp. TaxID=156424 RepID=UPI0026077E85|nr:DUF2970 domain-containing protein [uncultured Nitrosomonas sp.]
MDKLNENKKSDLLNQKSEEASVLQVAEAVFFSFIGVRKKTDLENDATKIKPIQVIIGGLIGGVIFIFSVLTVVKLVTG